MPLPHLSPDARRYLLGACLMGAAFSFPFTLLALYLDLLGASKTEVGGVVSGSSWGNLLAAIPAAILVSRLAPAWILASSALATALAYGLLPWAGPLWALFALNLAGGLFYAIHQVGGAPLLFRHSKPGERPRVFALSEASRVAASVLGALAAGGLATWLSKELGDAPRGHALTLSLASLLPLAAAFCYGRIADTQVRTRAAQRLFEGLLRHQGLVLRFALPQLLIAVGSGMTLPFMALYFRERFGYDSAQVGYLFAAGQLGMTLGFLGGPALHRRLGYVRAIALAQFASLPWFAVLALTHWAPLAALAYLLRTALMNAAHPLMKSFLMESAPEELREGQNALLMLIFGLGWVLGPALGGWLLDRSGGSYGALMAITIGFYVVGTSVFVWRLRAVETQLRGYQAEAAASYSP